jgi:hypothetical protein
MFTPNSGIFTPKHEKLATRPPKAGDDHSTIADHSGYFKMRCAIAAGGSALPIASVQRALPASPAHHQSQPRKKSARITIGSGNPSSQAARPYLIFPSRRGVVDGMVPLLMLRIAKNAAQAKQLLCRI